MSDRHYREYTVRLSGVSSDLSHEDLVTKLTEACKSIYPSGPEFDDDIQVELTYYSGELKGVPKAELAELGARIVSLRIECSGQQVDVEANKVAITETCGCHLELENCPICGGDHGYLIEDMENHY